MNNSPPDHFFFRDKDTHRRRAHPVLFHLTDQIHMKTAAFQFPDIALPASGPAGDEGDGDFLSLVFPPGASLWASGSPRR